MQLADRHRWSWIDLEQRVDRLTTASAFAVVLVMAVEVALPRPPWHQLALQGNWLIWTMFLADVAVKVRVFGPRWHSTRAGIFGLGIVLVTFPGLGQLASAGRLLRPLPVLRLARFSRIGSMVRVLLGVSRGLHGLKRIVDPAALPYVAGLVVTVCAARAAALYATESGVSPG